MTMQIASTAVVKKVGDMTVSELEATLSDMGEIVAWLKRDDGSYEEKCFAEEVIASAVVYSNELERRRASK